MVVYRHLEDISLGNRKHVIVSSKLVGYYRLTPSQPVRLSQGDTHFKAYS